MANDTTTRPDLASPRASFEEEPPRGGHEIVPLERSDTAIQINSPIITAQKVAVPRDITAVQRRVRQHAALYGKDYVYSWAVRDNRRGGSTTVEGPTIKAAMMIAKQYGNCIVDTSVVDFGDHWLFKAFFCDLETGYSLTRNFLQRKNQNTGMKDADRQADIVFQIGQSKALRNVVVNALPELTGDVLEAAKASLIDWLGTEKNKTSANNYIDGMCDRFNISIARIEAVVGRPRGKWNLRDLAKALTDMKGVEDGMENAEDIFPPLDSGGGSRTASTRGEQDKPTDDDKPAAKKAPAKKPAPKQEEPEPEPEPEQETSYDPETGEVLEEGEGESADNVDAEPEKTAADAQVDEEATQGAAGKKRGPGRPSNAELRQREEEAARKAEMEGVPQFDLDSGDTDADDGDEIPEF